MPKIYEIPDYLNKKVRINRWDKKEFIYFKEVSWFNESDIYVTLSPHTANVDHWEEYIEEKPKKKYVMYRHWFLNQDQILCYEDTECLWENCGSYNENFKFLETEIIKEFEI